MSILKIGRNIINDYNISTINELISLIENLPSLSNEKRIIDEFNYHNIADYDIKILKQNHNFLKNTNLFYKKLIKQFIDDHSQLYEDNPDYNTVETFVLYNKNNRSIAEIPIFKYFEITYNNLEIIIGYVQIVKDWNYNLESIPLYINSNMDEQHIKDLIDNIILLLKLS